MSMYERGAPEEPLITDRWSGGVGWLAHPDETGLRASHAFVGDEGGVWLIDPLDAPGIDDELATLGEVAGVVVLSNYHARDADTFAARHEVPVFVPRWLSRVAEQIERPTEFVVDEFGSSGFKLRRCAPFPGWDEAIAYREADGTLYIPDVLGTAPVFTVGDERLGMYLLCRLAPPRGEFEDLSPERILVGHGTGLFADAPTALNSALAGARRQFPTALLQNGWVQLRALTAALGD
ncbi:hypothetical protein [Halobaculum magnesiiphilum]|uniref:Uncharacterized protein n=1 Tax=Halobaculum magnesiiphilum TaxID=1017351 RepID=A0A8T8WIG0_9EURY|nr:hypothetical protein [Halobaculum magnesiiphilum]QZP39627.1 hypothetical protein K6T50_16685 [Halobaculum magnesiiphilum]